MSHLRRSEATAQPLDSILSINYTDDMRVYNAFKLLYSHTVGLLRLFRKRVSKMLHALL